jgi:hypothetical protein
VDNCRDAEDVLTRTMLHVPAAFENAVLALGAASSVNFAVKDVADASYAVAIIVEGVTSAVTREIVKENVDNRKRSLVGSQVHSACRLYAAPKAQAIAVKELKLTKAEVLPLDVMTAVAEEREAAENCDNGVPIGTTVVLGRTAAKQVNEAIGNGVTVAVVRFDALIKPIKDGIATGTIQPPPPKLSTVEPIQAIDSNGIDTTAFCGVVATCPRVSRHSMLILHVEPLTALNPVALNDARVDVAFTGTTTDFVVAPTSCGVDASDGCATVGVLQPPRMRLQERVTPPPPPT